MKNLSITAHYYLLALLALFFVPATFAGTTGAYDISATKKKQESSTEKTAFRPNLERGTDSYYYEISVRSTSPLNPAKVSLEYLIFVENPNGQIVLATKGRTPVTTSLAGPVKVKTDTFDLKSVEIDRDHRRDVDVESDVYGYAIRLVDGEGKAVAEKLSSSKIKPLVNWGASEQGTNELKRGSGKRFKKAKRF